MLLWCPDPARLASTTYATPCLNANVRPLLPIVNFIMDCVMALRLIPVTAHGARSWSIAAYKSSNWLQKPSISLEVIVRDCCPPVVLLVADATAEASSAAGASPVAEASNRRMQTQQRHALCMMNGCMCNRLHVASNPLHALLTLRAHHEVRILGVNTLNSVNCFSGAAFVRLHQDLLYIEIKNPSFSWMIN